METETDKIKQQINKVEKEILLVGNPKIEKDFNKLSDFDKNLILWIKEHKPIMYGILRNVSRSGMLRRFSVFIIKDNDILYLNYIISELTHYKRDNEGYIKVHGCGMDMYFALISDLSEILFNDYKILNYRLI